MWVIADDFRGLLCVELDNSPVEGVYFANVQERVPDARIDSVRNQQQIPTWAAALTPDYEPTVLEPRGYRVGDLLKVHSTITTTAGTQVEAVAPLAPRAADTLGACVPGPAVRFLNDVPASACWMEVQDLATACRGALDPTEVARWTLRRSALGDSTSCGSGRCLGPNVTVLCAEGDASCSAGSALPLRSAVLNSDASGGCSCQGSVGGSEFVFVYELDATLGGAVISAVEAHVTLQDVFSHGCQPLAVEQKTAVRFVERRESQAARERSGNPGYIVGLPLLVAQCKHNDEVTGACDTFDGFVQDAGAAGVEGILPDGLCSVATPDSAARRRPIRFGEDALFGCVLEMHRAELASFCTMRSDRPQPTLLTLPWSHVAATGDVPPTSQQPGDWVLIGEGQAIPENRRFADGDLAAGTRASNSTCLGVYIGVDLEVLYTSFGEVSNPQLRIVAARRTPRIGALTHDGLDSLRKQAFQFTATVSFFRLEDTADPETVVPERPPLPKILPHDLFYPFRLGSSAQGMIAGRRSATIWPLAVAAVLLHVIPGAQC